MNNVLNNKYPLPVHLLPEEIQDFIHCVVAASESSEEVVVPVVLSAAAAAVQALFDVKTPYGAFRKPVSLNVAVILRSGERKSTVRDCVVPVFEEFEQGLIELETSGYVELNLTQYQAHPFIVEKATEEGLIDLFNKGAKSAFVAPDEGKLTLQRLDMPAACKRYDGATIRALTRKHGAIALPDRRTSVCLLIQGTIFENFMRKKGDLLIESGFMPRTLLSFATQPATMCAQYSISPKRHQDPLTHPFQDRIRAFLKAYARSLGDPAFRREQLVLTAQAEAVWYGFNQKMEQMLMCDPSWEELRPFVRRAGENVLRLAAVLQRFSSSQLHVERWAVDAAIGIVQWHLAEAKRVFGELPIEVQMQQLAERLYDYLLRRASIGMTTIPRSELLRCAPVDLRKADRLEMALHHLLHTNRIITLLHGKKEFIMVNANQHSYHARMIFDYSSTMGGGNY